MARGGGSFARQMTALAALVFWGNACGGRGALEAYDDEGAGGLGGAGGAPVSTTTTTITSSVTSSVSSTTTSVGPTTVVSSTSSGPMPLCDQTGDCSTCFDCSSNGGQCTLTWQTCFQNPGCIEAIECMNGCFDDPFLCLQGCSATNPGGGQLLEEAIACTFCDECMNDCAGSGFCN